MHLRLLSTSECVKNKLHWNIFIHQSHTNRIPIVLFGPLETVLETVSQFIIPMKFSNNISHGSKRIIAQNSGQRNVN